MILQDFNAYLYRELRKRKLTQAQLAARMKINRVNLNRRMNAQTEWTAVELVAVSKILGYGTLSEMLKEAGL